MKNPYINIILSTIYTIISIAFFIFLFAAAVTAPAAFGVLIIYIGQMIKNTKTIEPPTAFYIIAFLSPLASIITAVNLFRSLKQAVSIPEDNVIVTEPNINYVVKKVADD